MSDITDSLIRRVFDVEGGGGTQRIGKGQGSESSRVSRLEFSLAKEGDGCQHQQWTG